MNRLLLRQLLWSMSSILFAVLVFALGFAGLGIWYYHVYGDPCEAARPEHCTDLGFGLQFTLFAFPLAAVAVSTGLWFGWLFSRRVVR